MHVSWLRRNWKSAEKQQSVYEEKKSSIVIQFGRVKACYTTNVPTYSDSIWDDFGVKLERLQKGDVKNYLPGNILSRLLLKKPICCGLQDNFFSSYKGFTSISKTIKIRKLWKKMSKKEFSCAHEYSQFNAYIGKS